MNRYKKSSNQRRNERIRGKINKKKINPSLKLEIWVALPIDEYNKINFNSNPISEVSLRKQEVDYTNNFLELNNQQIRYVKKSDWKIRKNENK
jgi:hypothetical protein